MIAWLQPAALWGLTLLAVPLAIHLLRTRHAARVPFPSVRFVPQSRTAAVRLRPPSDLRLLACRLAIVASAAAAAAQPLWLTPGRRAAWDARLARAVVVDTSASMRANAPGGHSALDDAKAVAAAEASAAPAIIIEEPNLDESLRRGAAWLKTAPPARRELVVISDFHQGALAESSLAAVPAEVGLRFVAVRKEGRSPSARGGELLAPPGVERRVQIVRVWPEGTDVTLEHAAARRDGPSGFRILGGVSQAGAERLLMTLAAAGTPAPDLAEPVALRFAGAADVSTVSRLSERWMMDTVMALEQDEDLAALARRVEASPQTVQEPWLVVLTDGTGRPLLRAAAMEQELLLDVAAPIDSYFAAAAARAALVWRRGSPAQPELEVLDIPRRTLDAWTRVPGPVPSEAWRFAGESDGRWLWAAVLVLLVAEHWLRTSERRQEHDRRAAA